VKRDGKVAQFLPIRIFSGAELRLGLAAHEGFQLL
jgi:hypothetical protein